MATTPRTITVDVEVRVVGPVDLPCPKCGHRNVVMRYQEPWPYGYDRQACPLRRVEHFHRTCQRCRYDWPTDDVIRGEGTESGE